ncbi:MAG: AAA family ATPase [Gammaproteobacteria bacterium]|nr:AAA family ATPase [Gammaproteobacteria bacterium]
MFEQYYGLTEKPFNLTPDTEFFYNSFSHQEALNVLLVALNSGEGFIKVTGEVGTGKTLLCRKVLEQLNDSFETVYIPNPFLDTNALFLAIVDELGIPHPETGNYLKIINQHLLDTAAKGKQTVLLLDEAQSIPEGSLEAIRLLSNLETEKQKLIQIILFGQPELNTKLEKSSIRQLQQRIMHTYELVPLSESSLALYIHSRLNKAGYSGAQLFSQDALHLLFTKTKGVPRLINILASKSLLSAFSQGDFYIQQTHVKAAIEDSDFVKDKTIAESNIGVLVAVFLSLLIIALWMRIPL